MESARSSTTASCPTRCSVRRSRSRLCSSIGRRARRSGNRSCCRMRSASRPCSSGWRTTSSCSATRLLPHARQHAVVLGLGRDSFRCRSRCCSRCRPTSRCARGGVYRTLLIWPYAVAPAVAGVLWAFMFQPSFGVLARGLRELGIDWNPLLNGNHAMTMVVPPQPGSRFPTTSFSSSPASRRSRAA